MYHPFLRGRQFELIALRELLEERALSHIQPIIEPVNNNLKPLRTCLEQFQKHEQAVYLIINPSEGDLRTNNDPILELFEEFKQSNILPAMLHDRVASSSEIIASCGLDQILLICEAAGLEADDVIIPFVELANISKVLLSNPEKNRSFTRKSKKTGKPIIRLDDQFQAEPRNSDFLKKEESRFTEEHRYYADEQFAGFSDYTVLPSDYIEGGSAPRAVVLHWTFERDEDIWIRHFTSETNDSIANVQGKFQEAANKVIRFCTENNLSNSAIQELQNYLSIGHYPGLGIAKKLSIKNHLLVVENYLLHRSNDHIQ